METKPYSELLQKIDEFIRKYYKNQLIKGLIYSVGILVLFFLLLNFIEFFSRPGTVGRAILFYSYIITAVLILIWYIIIPLFHLKRIGKIISHQHASEIIGKHFINIKDKLLNTLLLKNQLDNQEGNAELIAASIDQRIAELKPFPFKEAIDLKQNRKYLKIASVPLVILLIILIISPSFLANSSKRIISYNKEFAPESPFEFILENKDLSTPARQDFILQVKMDGKELPDQVYVDINGNKFKMDKSERDRFSFTFRNVQSSTSFKLYADGFYSEGFEIKALPDPVLLNFRMFVDYPSYTGKKDEYISNNGDLNIPAGTKINWEFSTRNTEKVQMKFSDSLIDISKIKEGGMFGFSKRFTRDNSYRVLTSNQFLKGRNEVEYQVKVIPDEYPEISVEEKQDSTELSAIYFRGEITDDYGFQKLLFQIRHFNGENTIASKSMDIPINRNFTQNTFYWDQQFSELNMSPGDEIEYWFEVWDNDGINGSKSSASQKRIYKIPSLDELQQMREKSNQDMKTEMRENIKEARQIQKELEEMNRRLLDKKEISWQDKKKVQELIQKQEELSRNIEQIQNEIKKNNRQGEEFLRSDERILEKQKELEKIFDQIMSEEMKEKLRELQKMMENMDKEKVKNILDQMKLDSKSIEKELDRSLELFKQLEFEQKFSETLKKLEKIKDKQEELSEKKGPADEQIRKEQDSLNKEFKEFRNEMNELEKKNKELSDPTEMENSDNMEQEIQQDMENSSKDLQGQKSKKASQSQKSAAQKMEKLADKMKKIQEEMETKSMEEDIGKLREILENLLQLSFTQEKIIKQTQRTPTSDPFFVSLTAEQKSIKDNAKMIEDTLFALSKRVEQINAFINREIASINMNLDKTIRHLVERQSGMATMTQKLTMTSVNNLALMLSEITNQMQQQMAAAKAGNGSCNKPGKAKKPGAGKPSLSTMRQLQQQLNEQMQKMKEGMGKPGGQKGGKTSEQLARMAAQQEMLRNELQKLMNEMMKEGNGNAGNLKNIAKDMEKTETDIVNKNISPETLKRQQEILTRLLEAEKAERERDQDNSRESNENKMEQKRNISNFDQFNKFQKQESELLKTMPPSLKPFYKNLVKDYFNTFD